MNARTAYTIVVPSELESGWSALPRTDQRQLDRRLRRAARTAWMRPTVWPAGEPGVHRGLHRALAGDLWVLYQLDSQELTLKLISFGYKAAVEAISP